LGAFPRALFGWLTPSEKTLTNLLVVERIFLVKCLSVKHFPRPGDFVMSGTQKAIGKAVEWVMREHAARNHKLADRWMTVGQVAGACEISKPTARKYMRMLVEAGLVLQSVGDDWRQTEYYLMRSE
jgi:hypothetical protein